MLQNASSSQIRRQFCEKEPFFFRIHESIIQRPRSKTKMTYLLHQQVFHLLVYEFRKHCFNYPYKNDISVFENIFRNIGIIKECSAQET